MFEVLAGASADVFGSVHGGAHWQRVGFYGATLAGEIPGADLRVVLLFAALHDARRESDGRDPEHGLRAAVLAADLHGRGVFRLGDEQLEQLVEACARHADGGVSADPTVGICFDSDRLDLWRLGLQPDPRFLSTESARRRIGWAEEIARSDTPPMWADVGALSGLNSSDFVSMDTIYAEANWGDVKRRWNAAGSGQELVDKYIATGVPAFAASHRMTPEAYRSEVEERLRRLTREAQVRIRVPLAALPKIKEEGRLRNTFELAESRLSAENENYRREWERSFLGLDADTPGERRPKYGYLYHESWGDELAALDFYGEATLVLDDAVKERCSVIFGAFAGERMFITGTPAPLLTPTQQAAFPFDILDIDYNPAVFPPEVQIVGGVSMADVVDVIGGPGLASGPTLP